MIPANTNFSSGLPTIQWENRQMKRINGLFVVVFFLISMALSAVVGQDRDPPLPTSAEVFQESVDQALEISDDHFFLIAQTIHAQRECHDMEGIRTTFAKALPRIRAISKPEERYAELEALASAVHEAGLEELASPLFDEAVKTVDEIPHPAGRVSALVTLSAFRSLKQNKMDTIAPLFNEAKEYAFALSDIHEKSGALAIVATRELELCGGYRWSRISQNASDIPPVELPRDTEKILSNMEKAMATILSIPEAGIRDRLLDKAVGLYVKTGSYSRALGILQYYDAGVSSIMEALSAIAQGLVTLDDISANENLVDDLIRISGDGETLLLSPIQNDFQRQIERIRYFQRVIRLLAKLERFEEAMQWGKNLPEIEQNLTPWLNHWCSGTDEANYYIALSQGNSGGYDEAVQSLLQIEDDYWRNEGFWQLAMIQTKQGEFGKAVENALRIDDQMTVLDRSCRHGPRDNMKLMALRDVARIMYESGQRDEMLKIFQLMGQFLIKDDRAIDAFNRRSQYSASGLAAVCMLEMAFGYWMPDFSDYIDVHDPEAAAFLAHEAAKLLLAENDSLEKANDLVTSLWHMARAEDMVMAERIPPAIESILQKECEKEHTPGEYAYLLQILLQYAKIREDFDTEPIMNVIEEKATGDANVKQAIALLRIRKQEPDQPSQDGNSQSESSSRKESDLAKMLDDARKIQDLRTRCDQLRAVAVLMSGVEKSHSNE